jgi:hypothetical protein
VRHKHKVNPACGQHLGRSLTVLSWAWKAWWTPSGVKTCKAGQCAKEIASPSSTTSNLLVVMARVSTNTSN